MRFATYNASLNRKSGGALHTELASHRSKHAKSVGSLIRLVDPDVLLILELDKAKNQDVVTLFHDLYIKENDS
ncbi:MAG: endonuclease/exonuclease/phosphatase family protein, partial [Bradymonadia bacterium]